MRYEVMMEGEKQGNYHCKCIIDLENLLDLQVEQGEIEDYFTWCV